ncbi:hypothetical protein SBOR_3681 [Sclerotinia borealis F-4128]|uniref:Uncharacterized protein n=1 Tax=Sclerotinia borealis (strain F-4128) TaxID=1432307 RepID=W9CIW4_SCLBF|nr:hypothetical protein SBOR_3681 [Sclerotinia borealis F-4128]
MLSETTHPISVRVYSKSDEEDVLAFLKVIDAYPEIFRDNGTLVDIPEEDWMTIRLKENWQEKLPTKGAHVYPLSKESRPIPTQPQAC